MIYYVNTIIYNQNKLILIIVRITVIIIIWELGYRAKIYGFDHVWRKIRS